MRLHNPGKCTTSCSLIVAIFSFGCWQINPTLPYPYANDLTPIYPFPIFGLEGYSVYVVNNDWWPEMPVMHLQSMKQSLTNLFVLASSWSLTIKVGRVEVVSVDASVDAVAAVLAAIWKSPRGLLQTFSVICHHGWHRKHFRWSFPFLSSLLSLLSHFGPLLPLPPLLLFFAQSRASGASPCSFLIVAFF